MKPVHLLLAVVFVFTGWQLFPDGPLAYYILSALLGVVLLTLVGAALGGDWALVCAYGAIVYAMTAGCGSLFAASADGFHFLCDRGTGLPVSGFTLTLGILVLLWITRKKGR